MWYSNLYRRHLTDMHIEDWHPDFLKKFSPESYVENLVKAQVQYAMIAAQTHTGLSHYPTRSGEMHQGMADRPDMIKKTVDLCKEKGIKVCLYYSLIYNTREHDKHPEWRMLLTDGMSRRVSPTNQVEGLAFASTKYRRYGFCCLNNPGYLDFLHKQIDEILEYFDFEVFFFDMPFWNHTCYCPHCQERYRARYGTDIPVTPAPRSQEYYQLNQFKYDEMARFIQGLTDYIKAQAPDMCVEYNFAQAVDAHSFSACGEEVAYASDFVGGDLYGDLYNHAFACKFYRAITPNQPFEQMLSRCKPALRMHTLTKSLEELKAAVSVTMAHHGATLIIDAIDPVGTQDSRVYDRIGKVFSYQKPYEPYFTGKPIADVGIYYGIRSRIRKDPLSALVCCSNLSNTLTRAHIPFDITGSFGPLDRYSVIAAPMLSTLEEKDAQRLYDYVCQGGTLYLSGYENQAITELLTGHKLLQRTEENNLYIAPKKEYEALFGDFNADYPLPFDSTAPVVEPSADSTVLATLTFPYTTPNELRYAAIHSDPPGIPSDIPAVTERKLGKGKVIWSALPLEAWAFREYRDIMLGLLGLKDTKFTFGSDAPANVEITAYDNGDNITVNAVTLSEEPVEIAGFKIWVKTATDPSQVRLLPNEESIPFTWDNGYTCFTARNLSFFDMYQICF